MAHNLLKRKGQYAMFSVGEPPWHRLGTRLTVAPTAEQAIVAAGLDWKVVKHPMHILGSGYARSVPNNFAVVREDTLGKAHCPILGVVSKGYTLLQNREAFAFFDPIISSGTATYETAGALGQGERVWVLAKLKECIEVVKGDETARYLLLSNSHDGKSSVQIKFTPIRVVCQNTLTMALSKGPTVQVPHTTDLHERLVEAQRVLGLIEQGYGVIAETFKQLAKVQVNSERLGSYLKTIFPDPRPRVEPDERYEKRLEAVHRDREFSEQLFVEGRGNRQPHVAGTLWAAYNGVTEYIDYFRMRKSDDSHLCSMWFGEGYLIKARAFGFAEKHVHDWLN